MRSRWCEGMYSIYVIELGGRFVAMGKDIFQKRILINRANHGTGRGEVSFDKTSPSRFPSPMFGDNPLNEFMWRSRLKQP